MPSCSQRRRARVKHRQPISNHARFKVDGERQRGGVEARSIGPSAASATIASHDFTAFTQSLRQAYEPDKLRPLNLDCVLGAQRSSTPGDAGPIGLQLWRPSVSRRPVQIKQGY